MRRPKALSLLDISTGHLSIATRNLLDILGEFNEAGIMKREEGFFISAGLAGFEGAESRFPPDLLHVARYAEVNKFDYILFDRDGPDVPSLPYYGDGPIPEPSSFTLTSSMELKDATVIYTNSISGDQRSCGRIKAVVPVDIEKYLEDLEREPASLSLEDTGHTLADNGVWLTAGEASVRVFVSDTFVEVTVFPLGCEMDGPLSEFAITRDELRDLRSENPEISM